MADLAAVTPTDVRVVKVIDLVSGPAGEAINAGQLVGYNAATGLWVKADADAPIVCKGIAITTANAANIAIDVLKIGIVDVGSVLDGLNYGASIYPSGTAGLMADAAVGGQPAIGDVVPSFGTTTPDKLLRVKL